MNMMNMDEAAYILLDLYYSGVKNTQNLNRLPNSCEFHRRTHQKCPLNCKRRKHNYNKDRR